MHCPSITYNKLAVSCTQHVFFYILCADHIAFHFLYTNNLHPVSSSAYYNITVSVTFCLQQIYAERDSLMLEDIERLKAETSVREERYNEMIFKRISSANTSQNTFPN